MIPGGWAGPGPWMPPAPQAWTSGSTGSPVAALAPFPGDEYAATARRLAARLAALATPGADGAPQWSGDDVDPSSPTVARLVHGPVDDGLLTGRAGIALALATCALLPGGQAEWGRLAVHALTASVAGAHAGLAPGRQVPGAAGWQSGALGIAHAAARVGTVLRVPPLLEAARQLAGVAVRALDRSPSLVPPYPDLLDGVAGHLLAVLAADLPGHAEPARREVAGRLAAELAGAATTDHRGARWSMAGTMGPVCGLAHGSSGAALALSEAAAAGIPGPWEELARAAVRWEATHHDPSRGGWPDLRLDRDVPGLAWCHGALGIGVAAARRHRLTGDGAAMVAFGRAHAAARLTEAMASQSFDATLCHGFGGLLEMHLVAAEQLCGPGRPQDRAAASEHLAEARRLARAVTRAGVDGAPTWTCGLPHDGLTPIVLTGIAGVALIMARCHDPALVPSPALPGPASRGRAPVGSG